MSVAPPRRTTRRPLGDRSATIGLVLVATMISLTLLGPLFTGSPTELRGSPFSAPGGEFLLGTDFLGRDLLARLAHGGRSVVLLAGVSTAVGSVLGTIVGLLAAFWGRWADAGLMRAMDVLLAFPPIIFLLVLATGAGASVTALVLGIAVLHVAPVARIVRTAALDVVHRGFVEAAVARGERPRWILRREVLPHLWPTILADLGPRYTVSILLVAAVNFLGLGLQPPASDWALMISENRPGLTIQPWAVVIPAALIALLTIGVNLVADAVARGSGASAYFRFFRR